MGSAVLMRFQVWQVLWVFGNNYVRSRTAFAFPPLFGARDGWVAD
jgi:hypothetical protein